MKNRSFFIDILECTFLEKITRILYDFGPRYNLKKVYGFNPSYNLEIEKYMKKF